VLKGIPGKVVGPGHNSTVIGPDGKTLFMVYHAWDPGHTARRLCIDPIFWTPDGPKVDGPSTTPRPLHPTAPGGGGESKPVLEMHLQREQKV
jgi:hypothetical protein